jgi:hypothetical protein
MFYLILILQKTEVVGSGLKVQGLIAGLVVQ